MGTFLLLLFVFFIVVPLFKVAWRVFLLRKEWKKATQQMNDAFRSTANHTSSAGSQRTRTPRRKKKIDPNVGEYVAFEEIHETTSQSTTTDGRTTTVRTESQIEDAVWEEIK